ncbi:hypothetical protein PVAP13_1NG240319 [Panicum virgatum]|uniref:Uncharacterized protein n=1 Tax=Panicum virgatum TaxID=38727 RepID=A0A8T0WX38_PANVG|nr:hypothetical protein PVAP13_1NG240319 [Panicum virgatum]
MSQACGERASLSFHRRQARWSLSSGNQTRRPPHISRSLPGRPLDESSCMGTESDMSAAEARVACPRERSPPTGHPTVSPLLDRMLPDWSRVCVTISAPCAQHYFCPPTRVVT